MVVVEKYVKKGHAVQVKKVSFGPNPGPGHSPLEYEVYVRF